MNKFEMALKGDLQRRLNRFFAEPKGRSVGGLSQMGVASTTGPFRDSNEDRAAVARIQYPNGVTATVAIVCDGMGGLTGGAEAASSAISAFLASLTTAPNQSVRRALDAAVWDANEVVYARFGGDGGTTLTATFMTETEVWAAHVGDSRLYGFNEESGLSLLSRDDTVQGAIQVHRGVSDEDELDNRLLQFVGIGEAISPHIFPLEQSRHQLWLITSDGAHVVGRKALTEIVTAGRDPSDIVRKLIFVAEAFGTQDNASAACVMPLVGHRELEDFGGTSLSVWSPTQNLEIWLAGTAVIESTRNRQNDRVESAASTGVNVGQRRKGTAKKVGTKSRKKRPVPRTDSDQPEMQVLFNQNPKVDD